TKNNCQPRTEAANASGPSLPSTSVLVMFKAVWASCATISGRPNITVCLTWSVHEAAGRAIGDLADPCTWSPKRDEINWSGVFGGICALAPTYCTKHLSRPSLLSSEWASMCGRMIQIVSLRRNEREQGL